MQTCDPLPKLANENDYMPVLSLPLLLLVSSTALTHHLPPEGRAGESIGTSSMRRNRGAMRSILVLANARVGGTTYRYSSTVLYAYPRCHFG